MEMLKILTREKQSTETLNTQIGTTPLGSTSGDTPYQQGFALPHETQTTYASPSQPFPFNNGPPQVMNIPRLVMQEPKANVDPMDPLEVPNLDEIAEKRKSPQDKALEKYELLEERMRAMEGINISGSLDAPELSLVSGLSSLINSKPRPSTNMMAPNTP